MNWRLGVCAAWAGIALAACHPNERDLAQLQRFGTQTSVATAAESLGCDAVHKVCVRLDLEQGAACLELVEIDDAAQRQQMRSCALADFRQARRLMPENPDPNDRLAADKGLASALTIARDNAEREAGPALSGELADLLPALAGQPAGLAYAQYFRGNNTLYRVQVGVVPADAACAALHDARRDLPQAPPDDLRTRVSDLAENIKLTETKRCDHA